MTTFSFSCTVGNEKYTGTVTFEGETKESISKIKDLDALIKKTVTASLYQIPSTMKKDINITFRQHNFDKAYVELVKNIWNTFKVPECPKEKEVKIQRIRRFSLVRIVSVLASIAEKISRIFQRIFKIAEPSSFGVSLSRDKYERAVKILNLILNKVIEDPNELKEEDRQLVRELIGQIENNEKFSKYLHDIREPNRAEKQLSILSFSLLKKKSFLKSFESISECFKELGVSQLVKTWTKIYESLEKLKNIAEKKNMQEITELLNQIDPATRPSASIDALVKLENLLRERGIPEAGECESLRKAFRFLDKKMNTLIDRVNTQGYEGPLSAHDLYSVYVVHDGSQLTSQLIDIVKKWNIFPESKSFKEYEEMVKKANDIDWDAKTLILMFPASISGDIELHDEALEKAFTGSSKPIMSQKKGLSSISTVLKLLFHKKLLQIQPFLGGARTHAAIFGQNTRYELLASGYRERPLNVYDSLQSVTYRPVFSKLLSSAGSEALKKLFGTEIPSEKFEELLQNLFAQHMKKFVSEHKKELEKIQLDIKKGAIGLIISKIIPTPLQNAVSEIFRKLMEYKSPLESKVVPITDPNLQEKMFCSEFVATVWDDVEKLLESDLKQRYRDKFHEEPPEQILLPLIPPNLPKDRIYPTRYEELIKDKCIPLPPPLAVSLLFKREHHKTPK